MAVPVVAVTPEDALIPDDAAVALVTAGPAEPLDELPPVAEVIDDPWPQAAMSDIEKRRSVRGSITSIHRISLDAIARYAARLSR